MIEFNYFTRSNTSPQGKSKVFYLAHPDDYDVYFDSICKELLDRQDLAVFCYNDDVRESDRDDYEFQLNTMQLFVIPVTVKLLTTPNRAIDHDIPFAVKRHIPILPLVQEPVSEALYSEKLGDRQYLDKNITDPTAISYDEKLTGYLNTVIVGSELAEQVRNSFDAYIFLSYRKKDRKEAQELMKLIHENPFCRDIAIWYDEFLTPGEVFTDAIRKALEKSELFALAVTPSVLEENNYIHTTEYPLAQRMKKKILPAEIRPTDHSGLKSLYSGLPEIVGTEQLSDALMEALHHIAVTENDHDPQHNYFIGLAYLSGIDVEINHERAVSLITSAAKENYVPAITKLVTMYSAGEGVRLDSKKALEWQQRIIDLLYEQYRKKPSEKTGIEIYEAMRVQFEISASSFDAEGTIACLRKEAEALDAFYRAHKSKVFLRSKNLSLSLLGKLLSDKNPDEAEKCFKEVLSSCSRFEFFGREKTQLVKTLNYYHLGELRMKRGDLQKAEEYFMNVVRINNNSRRKGSLDALLSTIANAYHKLAKIAEARGDLKKAKEYYAEAFRLNGMSDDYGRSGASELADYAALLEKEGRIDEAAQTYRKAIDESALSLKESADKLNIIEYSLITAKAADYFARMGDSEQSITVNLMSAQWLEKLIFEMGDLSLLSIYLERCALILKHYTVESDEVNKEKWLYNMKKTAELYIQNEKSENAFHSVFLANFELGEILTQQRKFDDAFDCYQKAFEAAKQMISISDTLRNQKKRAEALFALGKTLMVFGEYVNAGKILLAALNSWRKLADTGEVADADKRILSCCYRLGCVYEKQKDIPAAEEYFARTYKQYSVLDEQSRTELMKSQTAQALYRLGDLRKSVNLLNQAYTMVNEINTDGSKDKLLEIIRVALENAAES